MKKIVTVFVMCSFVCSNALGAVTWFNVANNAAVTSAQAEVEYEYPWAHLSDSDTDDDTHGGGTAGQVDSNVDLRNGRWDAYSKTIWNTTGSGAFSVMAENDPHNHDTFDIISETRGQADLQATTSVNGGNVQVKYYFKLMLNKIQADAGSYMTDDFGGLLKGPKGTNFTVDYHWVSDKLIVKRYNGTTLVSTTNVTKTLSSGGGYYVFTFSLTDFVNMSANETMDIMATFHAVGFDNAENKCYAEVTVVGSL